MVQSAMGWFCSFGRKFSLCFLTLPNLLVKVKEIDWLNCVDRLFWLESKFFLVGFFSFDRRRGREIEQKLRVGVADSGKEIGMTNLRRIGPAFVYFQIHLITNNRKRCFLC